MNWILVTLFAAHMTAAASPKPEEAPLPDKIVLVDFACETLPAFVQWNHTVGVPAEDHSGRLVHFEQVEWPNVFFQSPEGGWDWSNHAGVGVSLFNPTHEPVIVSMRLDNDGADGNIHCNNLTLTAPPHARLAFNMLFRRSGAQPLWGMRGVPGSAQYGEGKPLDLTRITAFQVFLPRPRQAHQLVFEQAYVFGKPDDAAVVVPMPFVDAFGQYKHDVWPGKLQSETEFAERRAREEHARAEAPELPGRDRFGGWADGPKREATGWFRAENIDGKWWLVTPDGSLFFSLGITCVGTWERTFVEGRDGWFEWLPPEDDPLFGKLYQWVSGAHSGAEPIGGEGRTFGFYAANLIRKYGADWEAQWRRSVYPRLRHWGFNTIANWSQADVLQKSDLPFVVSGALSGVRKLDAATGYWSPMMDVYDPSFETAAENTARHLGAAYAANPLCIGYFVDNELAWEGVCRGALAGPPDQPARAAMIAMLRERYDSPAALAEAWETEIDDWENIAPPQRNTPAYMTDMDDFLYRFARRYFEVVRDALRRHAPHQLYLGCRFSTAPDPVVRACAEIADVVSFNLYYRAIPQDRWIGDQDLGKPILIGEFHFGALDRGMFHSGLVRTENQAERAAAYMEYVRSVADHPAFVGCHWFQYVDEPITGRWFDGENYNIGFLDVTDTPYPELIEAARAVHAEVYARRYGKQH